MGVSYNIDESPSLSTSIDPMFGKIVKFVDTPNTNPFIHINIFYKKLC